MKDKFNREIDYIRISVTDDCNLRCIYCIDDKSVRFLKEEEKLSDDELIRVIKECASLGIKKVRITGGEPLVRKGIVNLISRINNIEEVEEIHLTTNGILLGDKVEDLVLNGLKGVNISLDSLKEERFSNLTRGGQLNKVLQAIEKSIELGVKVKLNTVIVNDINKDEIIDFINLTINKPIDVRFIELMPIGIAKDHKGTSNDEILDIINKEFLDYEIVSRGKRQGPAKYIKVNNSKGNIGFISALSNCFCEECNRIRLTPEGIMKQCLHFNYGVNLKELMNNGISDEELKKIIYTNIYDKPEKHLFLQKSEHKELRFMNQIGG